MKRFLKFFALFGLIILTTGCGSQFKDEATVTIDAEPIILAAIKAKRNARDVGSVQEGGSPDGYIDDLLDDDDDESAYDDIQFTKEMIAAFDEAIEYKVDFKCSLTGDYKKTQTETIAISFSDMMQLEEVEAFEESTVYQELEENLPDFKFSGVPVGSRIKANVIMTLGTRIKDEDKLFDLILGAAYEGMTEQEIALEKLSLTPEIKRLMKNEFLDYFSMEELITAAGTSDEITVVEGSDNPIEVTLEFDVEIGFGSGEEGSISYTRYYYLDGYKVNTLTGYLDEETADELYDSISELETCPAILIESGYEYEVEKIIIEYTGTEAIEQDWLKLNEEKKQALCEDILQNAGSITIYCYINSTPIETPVDDVTCTCNLYENNIKVDTSTEELTRNYTYFKYTFEGLREIPDGFDDDDYICSIDKILITYTKDTDTTPETVTQDWLKIKDDDKDQFCKDMVADATAITVDYYVTSTPKVIPLEKYTATGSIVLGDIGLVTVGYDITEPLCLNIGELSFWAKDSNGTAVTDIDMEVKLLYGGRDLNEFAPLDDPYYLYSTANKTLQIEKRLSTAGTYQLLVTASVTGQSYVSNSVTLNFEVPDTIYYVINLGTFAPQDSDIRQMASLTNGLYLKFQGTGTNSNEISGTFKDLSELLYWGFASDDVTFDLSSVTGITEMKTADFGTESEMNYVTKLILPDSLETISSGAISRAVTDPSNEVKTQLTLVIGKNVNYITSPYKGSYNPICKYEVSPDNENFCTSSDGKYLLSKDGTHLIAGANTNSVTIPDSVLIIDENAFYGADLVTSINLNNVEKICEGAFYSIYDINVELPATVRAVGKGAFTWSNPNGAHLTDAGNTDWALTDNKTTWQSWIDQGFATEGEYSTLDSDSFENFNEGFVYSLVNDHSYAYRLSN